MLPATKNIAIYGAGGSGREIAWLLTEQEKLGAYNLVTYIDDELHGRVINGKPVLSWIDFSTLHQDALVVVAVGDPAMREKLAAQCSVAGRSFATLVHHGIELSEFVEIGTGSIVCSGSILTVNIRIGSHVQVNVDCTIAHDVQIGDFTTLSPGVHVSGHVNIGKNVYIGVGASIINGTEKHPLVIADGTVIGAGACVTKSTKPYCLYAGVPAVFKKSYR